MLQDLRSFFADHPLDMLAFVSGALGVWLTIKQNILCWPMALVSVLISIVVYFDQRLYGDMSLQVVYFFAGVYGWIYWKRNSSQAFVVQRTGRGQAVWLLLATAVQAVLYYFLLRRFNGDKPLLDGLLTAASLTATYMMTKKWVENWAVWVVVDGTYVFLYCIKGMWLFALLYLLFTIMSFYGWLKWRKTAA